MTNSQDAITFAEAVEYAKKYLTASKQSSMHSPSAPTDDRHTQNMILQSVGTHRIQFDPDTLVEESKHNPDAFDELRFGVATLLFVGKQLPTNVRNWLIEYLLGKRKPPKRKSGRHRKLSTEAVVIDLVERLVAKGMTATRNDFPSVTSDAPGESACDAIATAMSDLGLKPSSFDRISEIWQERGIHRAEVDRLLADFGIGKSGNN